MGLDNKIQKYLNANGDGGLNQSYLSSTGGHSNFLNSGGAAAGTAAAGSLVAAAQIVPVVGQVVAIVATLVSIGQVFHEMEKMNQWKNQAAALGELSLAQQQEIDVANYEAMGILAQINAEIERRSVAAANQTKYMYITMGLLGVSTMLFVYGLRKNK